MSGSLAYTTRQSSKTILAALYNVTAEDFFRCEIIVPTSTADAVEDGTLAIELMRLKNPVRSYLAANGDLVYCTKSRFSEDTETFDVDVVIRSREADVVGATIMVSPEALVIFDTYQRR